MVDKIIFGSSVGIWDSWDSEKVKIRIGTCRNPFLIPIYLNLGVETCIVVLIEVVFEAFEEHKPFIWTLVGRYFGSTIGMEVFWPLKDLSTDDVMTIMGLQ
jgi:hypothetical protein